MKLNSQLNVITELRRIDWTYEFSGADDRELKTRCPLHDDANPSCSINVEDRVFKCHSGSCGQSGDFITFLAAALRTTRVVMIRDLESRYGVETASRVIDPGQVAKYHASIWSAGPLLRELRSRGVSDDAIRTHILGYNAGRIMIPIYDARGDCVNIRRYQPGAPAKEKMLNTRGCGRPLRLYPIAQLDYDTIMICGGEMKAIVAAELLNGNGIGAITAVGGEGSWADEFTTSLGGKRVYVCLDIDDAGCTAARKICERVSRAANWTGLVSLPLSRDKYPCGDINDWVGREGAGRAEFLDLLNTTTEFESRRVTQRRVGGDDEAPEEVSLKHAFDATHVQCRIAINGVINSMDVTTYLIPRRVRVECTRDQSMCSECDAYYLERDDDGVAEDDIPVESPAILEMVGMPRTSQRVAMMMGLGIQPTCKVVALKPITYYNVEDAKIGPQLDLPAIDDSDGRAMQPILIVDAPVELNESYVFTGKPYPHPKTQQGVFLASGATPMLDQLSSYESTPDDEERLRLLEPRSLSVDAIGEKLDEIYADLEANVTQIYHRRDMHLVADLAYHSTLVIEARGQQIRGWVEALIIGDSSQGKSEMTTRLMNHYGLGYRIDCKNASVAGLLGGLQQVGGRWWVMWGVIPTHDRRLVILDELKGASTEVISKLTDMRSSGIAEIPKIERRRARARTRLIAISNPRSASPMSVYNFGVEAIPELIGSLEDVRRFDISYVAARADIEPSRIASLQANPPIIEHRLTAEVCRLGVLWAWTRQRVCLADDTSDELTRVGNSLCADFSDTIPLVDRGGIRYKLLRLAAALAARTHSTKTGDEVFIHPAHVKYVDLILRRVYSAPACSYDDYSRAIIEMSSMLAPDQIRNKIRAIPHAADFRRHMLHTNDIELRDICDWCGYDKQSGIELLSLLVRRRALRREGRAYHKTPDFIGLLKSIQVDDIPKHIQETDDEF